VHSFDKTGVTQSVSQWRSGGLTGPPSRSAAASLDAAARLASCRHASASSPASAGGPAKQGAHAPEYDGINSTAHPRWAGLEQLSKLCSVRLCGIATCLQCDTEERHNSVVRAAVQQRHLPPSAGRVHPGQQVEYLREQCKQYGGGTCDGKMLGGTHNCHRSNQACKEQQGAAASGVALSHLDSNINAVEQPLVHHSLRPCPQLHKPPLLILDQLQRQQAADVDDRQASRQAGRGRKVEAELADSFLRPMLHPCGKWPYLQFARR
jgi:hypothetical protein